MPRLNDGGAFVSGGIVRANGETMVMNDETSGGNDETAETNDETTVGIEIGYGKIRGRGKERVPMEQNPIQRASCAHADASHGHEMCISIVPIFNHLEDRELREIVRTVVPRQVKRGETIYSAGETSDRLYIVHKGRVKIYRLSENGKEQLVRILGPGDFTGELAVFNETVHDSYAEALENTELCTLGRGDLQAFLLKYPTISLRIMDEFARRLGQSEKQAASFATEPADTRIAMYLAKRADAANSKVVRLPMTRKDLASHLGTTPETISRKFAEFEDAGWIRQNGQKEIEIVDLDALLLV